MAIDATVGGASANSYLTVAAADAAMVDYPQAAAWAALSTPQKEALLKRGTRLIDRYTVWMPKKDAAQRLAFPRGIDAAGVIPEGVKNALLEFVDGTLDATFETLKKLQAEGVTSASILGQSLTWENDVGLRTQLSFGARSELDILKETQPTLGVSSRALDGSDDPESIFG